MMSGARSSRLLAHPTSYRGSRPLARSARAPWPFSFATVSSANDGTTPPQVIVKFRDLDISTSKGAAALYDRIQTAARNVCSRFVDPWNLLAMANREKCLDKTILDTVTKINSSALTAVYGAKTGKEVPTRLVSVSK
jgi:UrcA family protein